MSGDRRESDEFVVDDVDVLALGRPDDSLARQLWPEDDVPLIRINLKLHRGDQSGDLHYEMADEDRRFVVIPKNPIWPGRGLPALGSEPDVGGIAAGDLGPSPEEDGA